MECEFKAGSAFFTRVEKGKDITYNRTSFIRAPKSSIHCSRRLDMTITNQVQSIHFLVPIICYV